MGFKGLTILIALYGLLQGGSSQLVGKPSYGLVGPGVNEPAVLQCTYHGSVDTDEMQYSWLNEEHTILAIKSDEWVPDIVSNFDDSHADAPKMLLTINPLYLRNQGEYTCQVSVSGNISKAVSALAINRLPEVSLITEVTSVSEGDRTKLAACYANMSKPAPEMWFVDSNGDDVKSEEPVEVKDCGNGLTNSSLYLVRTLTREDNDKTYYCKVRHVNRTEVYSRAVSSIDVTYPPSASFPNYIQDSDQLLAEGSSFSAGCEVTGNPFPSITWTFVPDVAIETTDGTTSSLNSLPSNFIYVDDGTRIVSTRVVAGNQDETNNGTFTCTAENDHGVASAQFRLEVYELPTTTTPEATTVVVTVAQPITAGANAAVIAGVVAVAIFILVVTIILLLRYFMSHKGEYYTNELKASDDLGTELSDDDDDDLPRTEADLLGEKKRPEHFL